ncbi:hypothetical protein FRB96_002426 [Tulasnella sp. 330]|nr:hypothetical protein FRB96_002426 [Tulasnella sp. 330]KAG8885594.1 hypothetical protein FRB97_000502 [Tulasnella sp. 331]KAG8889928.1 hypothetical protein FRB98_001974 [Tulasnella sp. 332]
MSRTIDIPPALKASLRKFRFAKQQGNSALIAKVNKKELIIEEVEQLTNVDLAELADGEVARVKPKIRFGSETGMMTLHASAFIPFSEIADANRVLEIRDGPEGLTKEIVDKAVA